MTSQSRHPDTIRIGLVSVSDRASKGVYEDQGIPALTDWLARAVKTPVEIVSRLIQDDAATISAALVELVDVELCNLVLTTGGTGLTAAAAVASCCGPYSRVKIPWALRAAGNDDHLRLLRGIGARSVLYVPLVSHKGTIGVMGPFTKRPMPIALQKMNGRRQPRSFSGNK